MKSQNQIQHLVYALITVIITVHAFVFYSLYVVEGDAMMRATGTTSVLQAINSRGGVYMCGTYLPIWLMIIIESICAFVLAVTMGSPLAFRLASRLCGLSYAGFFLPALNGETNTMPTKRSNPPTRQRLLPM